MNLSQVELEPLGKRVVIDRATELENKHFTLKDGEVSILHMPVAKQRQQVSSIGTVFAVGLEVTTLKKGDRVVFSAHAGQGFMGADRLICYEADVLAKLNDGPTP